MNIDYYYPIYWSIMFVFLLYVLVAKKLYINNALYYKDNKTSIFIGKILLFFLIFYIGLRPLNGIFVDMTTYANIFDRVKQFDIIPLEDPLFGLFIKIISEFGTLDLFFFISAVIYIGCIWLACKNILFENLFILFFVSVTAFSFLGYAVNGLRNGLATSVFLLGLSISFKFKYRGLFIMISSYFIHSSMILPLLSYIILQFYNKPKHICFFWLTCIFLNLILGPYLASYFSSIIENERHASYFVNEVSEVGFSKSGFRWDFLLYSFIPIYIGYNYICKNLEDKKYNVIYSFYCISNSVWVLVNHISFSNRIAYLSWFIYPIVLFYPLLKNKNKYLKHIIFLYFMFSFVMLF